MTSYLNLFAVKPYDGGVEIKQLNRVDVKGMIPNFVTNYCIGYFSRGLTYVVDYYRDGKKPW